MKLVYIELILILGFMFFTYIRPTVVKSTSSEFLKIILFSLPNLFEAIVGTLMLTGVGLLINNSLGLKNQIRPKTIYTIAVVLAGIYVSAQELKIHNLGGNNVYDSNDLLFSFIGLIIGYSMVVWIQPVINNEDETETLIE